MDLPQHINTVVVQLDAAARDYHNEIRRLQNDPLDPMREKNRAQIESAIASLHAVHRERNELLKPYR